MERLNLSRRLAAAALQVPLICSIEVGSCPDVLKKNSLLCFLGRITGHTIITIHLLQNIAYQLMSRNSLNLRTTCQVCCMLRFRSNGLHRTVGVCLTLAIISCSQRTGRYTVRSKVLGLPVVDLVC
jgi:hypothetical protein